MLIKYTGPKPRTNSFGTFLPGRIVDVPTQVGEALLGIKWFQVVGEEQIKVEQMAEPELRQRVLVLVDDKHTLEEKVALLTKRLEEVEQELKEVRTGLSLEPPMDLPNPSNNEEQEDSSVEFEIQE